MDTFDFLQYMVDQEHESLDDLIKDCSKDELQLPMFEGDDVTIGERLTHILKAEYRMAGYLYKKEDEDEFEIDEISVDNLLNASIKAKERHKETLQNLTKVDLQGSWTSPRSGNTYENKYLIWHFIEHIATHRGQVASSLRHYREQN